MPNHFHILVHIPKRQFIPDEELLRRYQLLQNKSNRFQTARIEVIANWLKRDSAQGIAWREQQLALMFNLSAFISLIKQRFSIWFNKKHNLYGTLWAERFKSVLVEFDRHTLRTMAAYIDLNAVRKGLVSDPKDYRWCGYAEAVAGSQLARRGLHVICPHLTWTKAQADYRCILYSVGSAPREKGHVITPDAFETVMTANGELPLGDLLRHRWRYFTYAAILGRPAFVAQHRAHLSANTDQSTPPPTPWGNWATLRRPQYRPRSLF